MTKCFILSLERNNSLKKNEAFDSSDEYNFLIFTTIAADRAPEPNLTPGLKNPGVPPGPTGKVTHNNTVQWSGQSSFSISSYIFSRAGHATIVSFATTTMRQRNNVSFSEEQKYEKC